MLSSVTYHAVFVTFSITITNFVWNKACRDGTSVTLETVYATQAALSEYTKRDYYFVIYYIIIYYLTKKTSNHNELYNQCEETVDAACRMLDMSHIVRPKFCHR